MLPSNLPYLISIGRLDYYSEGLLLFTNCATIASYMESPAVGLEREYIVRIRGSVGRAELDKLGDGVHIDGIHYKGECIRSIF